MNIDLSKLDAAREDIERQVAGMREDFNAQILAMQTTHAEEVGKLQARITELENQQGGGGSAPEPVPSINLDAIPDNVQVGEQRAVAAPGIPDGTKVIYHVWATKSDGATDWNTLDHEDTLSVTAGVVVINIPNTPGVKLIQLYTGPHDNKTVNAKKRVTIESPVVTIPTDVPSVPSGAGVRTINGLDSPLSVGDKQTLVLRDANIQCRKGAGTIRGAGGELWMVGGRLEGVPFSKYIRDLTNCPFQNFSRIVLIGTTTNSLHGLIHGAYGAGYGELYGVKSTNHYGDWIQGGGIVRDCTIDGLGYPKLPVDDNGRQEHADGLQVLRPLDLDGLVVTNYDAQIATFGHQWGSNSKLLNVTAREFRGDARNGLWVGSGDPIGGTPSGGGASNVLIKNWDIDTPCVFGSGNRAYGGTNFRIEHSKFSNEPAPIAGRVEVVK